MPETRHAMIIDLADKRQAKLDFAASMNTFTFA